MSQFVVSAKQYRELCRRTGTTPEPENRPAAPRPAQAPRKPAEPHRRDFTAFDLTERISVRLPWPPSVNKYWRTAIIAHHVQVYISAEGKAFRQAAVAAWHDQHGLHGFGHDRLAIRIVAVFPDTRQRDLDNLCKATLDALSHAAAWRDDSCVKLLIVEQSTVQAPGWLDVTIGPKPGVDRQTTLFQTEDVF